MRNKGTTNSKGIFTVFHFFNYRSPTASLRSPILEVFNHRRLWRHRGLKDFFSVFSVYISVSAQALCG